MNDFELEVLNFCKQPYEHYELDNDSACYYLLKGDYKEVLSIVCKELTSIAETTRPKQSEAFRIKAVETILINVLNDNSVSHIDIFALGVASLQLFVQYNWTGPQCHDATSLQCQNTISLMSFLQSATNEEEINLRESIISDLTLDGESLYSLMKHPELLYVARIILCKCVTQLSSAAESVVWWQLRCLYIHQNVLDEKSSILYSELTDLLTDIPCGWTDDMTVCFRIEVAYMYLCYIEMEKAKVHLKIAVDLCHMVVSVVGSLGKRTRFQQHDLPQLTLSIKKEQESIETLPIDNHNFPKDLSLDDELRLNKIKFKEETTIPNLNPIEQAVVLANFFILRLCRPQDDLTQEELLPYLDLVLSQPKCRSLHITALYNRCKLESKHVRTVTRAMMQCQELVDSIDREESNVTSRLKMVYTANLPPMWVIQRALAIICFAVGSYKSALDEFLKLELWENVIECYHGLHLRHKAEEVIRRELSKGESPKLWCLLGDATDDPSYYEKAWKMSGERSGRAQRQWGLMLYRNAEYAEAIPHLKQSLEVNSLQPYIWVRLAFSAMQTEDWALCAKAYRHYCNLDSESFEAWNNLSSAYVNLGERTRALKALQEAVKCNYEQWKVWDNLMMVAVDVGDFEEALRSYSRLLELKEKHVDEEVLSILTKSIINNINDCYGKPASIHRKNALKLFGQLTAQIPGNFVVWQLYAELTASVENISEECQQRVGQYLQKAYRSAVQKIGWEKEVETALKVIALCQQLAEVCLSITSNTGLSQDNRRKILSSTKLSLRSAIVIAKKFHTNPVTNDMTEDIHQPITRLEIQLQSIVDQIEKL